MKLELYGSEHLNFVELNYTGGNNDFIPCDKESKYIDSIVFDVFIPCFETANKLYDYTTPTKYNSRKLIPLRNELIKNLDNFQRVNNIEEFIKLFSKNYLGKDFLEELVLEEPDWKENWKEHLGKLITINKELIELAEICAGEEKILWVIGY